jgi:hypothetical protein
MTLFESELLRQDRALAWAQCYATILAGFLARAHGPVNMEHLRDRAETEANRAYSYVRVSV